MCTNIPTSTAWSKNHYSMHPTKTFRLAQYKFNYIRLIASDNSIEQGPGRIGSSTSIKSVDIMYSMTLAAARTVEGNQNESNGSTFCYFVSLGNLYYRQ